MTESMALAVSDEYQSAIDREWVRIASPSSFFTGAERVALATEVRRERNGLAARTGGVSNAVGDVARKISTDAKGVREDWVEELRDRGLHRYAYVEIVGLAARLEAVDVFEFGVGRRLRSLPKPIDGNPTGDLDSEAAMNGAWVPTTAAPNAGIALSAVPNEHAAMHDFHERFFIGAAQILDFDLVKDLVRPQMELVAARTSMLNECFY